MEYCVAFHFINGREVRCAVRVDRDVDLASAYDELANQFAVKQFVHFASDDKLIVVNMSNVAYFRIFKVEED